MMDLPAYFKYAFTLLMTPNGIAALLGLAGVVWLARMYLKKIEIPGLTVAFLKDESWFLHRDDSHRLVIVVSLELTNRSGQEARFKSIKFSGYSPRREAPPVLLDGKQTSVPAPFPEYDQYYEGAGYGAAPFTTQRIWLYFESGSVDLRNRMSAPLVLKTVGGRRTSVRVDLYRHPHQVQLYREQWV